MFLNRSRPGNPVDRAADAAPHNHGRNGRFAVGTRFARTLTLGRLRIRDRNDDVRGISLELYGADGDLAEAWLLEVSGAALGIFDPHNPRRLLIWNQGERPGVTLIEVDAPGYPS